MSFNEIDNQPDMDIVNSFLERVELLNSKPGEWFIGIACDVIKDVYMTHGINLNSDSVFIARAADEKAAKNTAQFIISQYHTNENIGCDMNCIYVYGYIITLETSELY